MRISAAFGVLAAHEHVDGVAERARLRERVVDDGVDDHGWMIAALNGPVQTA